MAKNILIAGVLGGAVMFVVMLAGRLVLQGSAGSGFRMLADQPQIHAALKERIAEPGTYVCPYLPAQEIGVAFPDYLNEPIFEITYKGYTHATVPGFASVGMLSFLLAPLTAAWLLSQASARVLSTFARRVAYTATLGVFLAVGADLLRTLSDELPFSAVVGPAAVSVITWFMVGLVLAWQIKPATARS